MKRTSNAKLRRLKALQHALRGRRPSPLGVSLARFSSALAVAGAIFAGLSSARALTYFWDSDGNATNDVQATQAGLGGAGTYDGIAPRFWDGSSASDVATTTLNDAIFFGGQAAGGAITFGAASGPLNANSLNFNSGGYSTAALTTTNTLTLGGTNPFVNANASASIGTAGVAGIVAATGFTKGGAGTLTVIGNNTGIAGAINVNGGTLNSSGNVNSLGSGNINLQLGTLGLLFSGAGSNTATPVAAYANNFIVNGNSTLTVNNAGANSSNTISIASLTINNSTLTVTNANTYGLQVVGATTLAGPLSTISTALTFTAGNANPTSNMVAFSGGVVGAGPLNKLGTGTVNLFGSNNTYSGGTNIFAGAVTLADNAATAGTGNIIVNPGAALAVVSPTGVTFAGSQTLAIQSAGNNLGILRLDSTNDIVTGSSLGSAFISPYGASVQLNSGAVNYTNSGVPGAAAAYAQSVNLSQIGSAGAGNGPIYFGASTNTTFTGTLTAANDNTLRFAGVGTLTLNQPNQLPGNTRITFGSPLGNIQTVTNGGGTFAVNNQNTVLTTIPITINKTATVQVAGTAVGTESPLGSAPIYILGGTLDTTASNFVGAAPQLGNTAVYIYQTATTAGLLLNNSLVTQAGGSTDLRLSANSFLGMYSGALTLTGSNTASTTTLQDLTTINASGGNTINLTSSATAASNADTVLNVNDIERLDNGTIVFARPGTTQPAQFGLNAAGTTDSRVLLTTINSSAVTPTSGMIAPWLVDGTSFTFLTVGANGITPISYDVTAATAANLQGATAGQKVDVTTALTTSANASVYALRVGNVALSGTNTITVNGNTTDGAGVIFNSTSAQTDTVNWSFGPSSGNAEAILYSNTAAIATTLSGSIAATGLTKFGPGTLALTGTNTALNGTVTVNQGILNGTPAGLNFRPIMVNAGTLQINAATTASVYNNDITINGDASLDTSTSLLPRIRTLTINQRVGSSDPMTLNILTGGLVVTGVAQTTAALTLNGPLNLNAGGAANQVILGNGALGADGLAGSGTLNKWGTGQVVIASSSANYFGNITINSAGGNNNNNVLRSQAATATATPFGSGSITVNPGGVLSIANPANITNNNVTLNSDLNGLATIAANYNGNAALPSVTTFNNTTLGGPFSAVLAIDAIGFSGAVNLNTFGGGTAFLGSANQTGNFTGALTPSTVGLANSVPNTGLGSPFTTSAATGVYRLGAGGGTLQFLGGPGQFAAGNDIQVGAINNVHQFTSVSLANGNGSAAIYSVNAGFNGNIILNGSTTALGQGNLIVGNDGALGSGTIIFNGGGIQADTNTGLPFLTPVRTISNPIAFAGDVLFGGATDLRLASPLALAPGQTGVTRTFNVANTTGLAILSGAITDGAGGATNSITKAGAGALVLTGGAANTYTGFTNIAAGALVVASDTDIPLSSQIVMAGGNLAVWNASFTTNRNYVATSTTTGFDIGAGKTLTQSLLSNISGNTTLVKSGLGTMILNGDNSMNGTNAVQLSNGILQVSANVNLGDPSINGTIVGATGTLRLTGSFSTPRIILPGANATTSITLDVTTGNTLTSVPQAAPTFGLPAAIVRNNGSGVFTVVKTGTGTYVNSGNNTETGLVVQNGTLQVSGNVPWSAPIASIGTGTTTVNTTAVTGLTSTANLYVGQLITGTGIAAGTTIAAVTSASAITLSGNATATGTPTLSVNADSSVAVNGGVLQLANSTVDQAVVSGGASVFAFGGGGRLALQSATGFSSQLTVPSITRSGVGTLTIDPGTSSLAVAGDTNNVRVIPTTLINTVAVASANVNGMLPGNIVTEVAGVGSFAAYDTAATGIKTFAGYTAAAGPALAATTATSVIDVTGAITAFNSPTQSVYALRTNSNIAGGTLKISSINGTTATNEGGLIINSSATIGANLIFDPTATTGSSANSGEGLIYVAPASSATISGAVTATSLVKFGSGNLTLSGTTTGTTATTGILNALTVQQGTLTLGGSLSFDKFQTDLVLNNAGTLDVAGNRVTFNSLGNTAGVTGGIAGGTVTSSLSGGVFVLNGNNTTGTTFAGNLTDGTGSLALVKSGLGQLTLGTYSVNNPNSGVNTYTGGTTITLGTLVAQDPQALGTGAVTLLGGTLNLQSNGGGINGTIILGNQSGTGSVVNVAGPATINVDRVAANTGNAWQIGNLNLSENNLNVTGANNYRLRASGTTTILGSFGSVTGVSGSASGTLELAGLIVSPNGGALNKFGADQSRYTLISGTANTYSGGTNIQSGSLLVGVATGTPLGTGRVNVFGNGTLRIVGLDPVNWANGTIGGAPVKLLSAFNALSEIGLDNDNFNPTAWLNTPGVINNSYGTVGVALTRPFWTRTIDQSAIGDGKTFLTGGINVEVDYIAPTLAPGLGDGTVGRIYRLAGGGNNNLAFTGADNVLSDYSTPTQVQIGSPTSIANNAALGLTGNSVIIRNSNNYTGGTIIWKGSALQIETGASPNSASNSPLGSGPVDVWGTLTSAGQNGSFVNAATGNNNNAIFLHPGGQITINDVAGSVTGGQGRWSDTAALNLNGGTLQFNGAAGYASLEAMGPLTVDKLSRIVVSRSLTAGVATLTTPNLLRVTAGSGSGAGVLLLQGSAQGSFGIPASTTVTTSDNTNYDRFIITTPANVPTLFGNTTVGANVNAGIATAGVAPAWIINTNDAGNLPGFMTYSPTSAGNTGFQGLVTAGSPGATALASVATNGTYSVGANQVGYSRVFGAGTGAATIPASILTGGTETVDINSTGTVTLADAATSVYALRTNNSINPLAGASPSLTIVGGGLIAVTNNLSINLTPVPNNAVAQNMTLNFGVNGAAEAVIMSQINLTVNAQIQAAGLTKAERQNNGGQLILTGDNLLTGPVTLDGGLIIAQNTLSGTGSAVPGVFGGQDVYLGGGVAFANVRLILNGTVGNAISALQPSAFAATTNLAGTIYVNGDSQLDNNNNAISQRINNLTFADLGAQKPIVLSLGSNIYISGTTTLASNTAINEFFNNSYTSTIAGPVVGPGAGGTGGTLNKYGNTVLLLSNGTNSYTGGTTVNATTPGATSTLASSFRGTGTPFGTGPIVVNPGGALRIIDPANIASNTLTVNSDGVGLGGLNLAYNATNSQIAALFGTGPGKANFTSTGDFAGVIGLDANNWNNAIDISALETALAAANPALAGKPLWLGTSNTPTQTYLNSAQVNYAAPTLNPGMGNILRIGGGGNQGQLALGAGQYENVITAATTQILVGTDTGGIDVNGPNYVNGQIGILEFATRNTAFTGSVTVANGSQISISNGNALANASMIYVNGGDVNIRNAQTVPNAITVTGDQFRMGENTGFNSGTFSGPINLAPNGVGGTRSFIAASNDIGFTGVISDGGTGTGASNIIRSSNQTNNNLGTIIFHGANTYHGTTTVLGGFLYVGTDVQPNVAGALGISDTPIAIATAANPVTTTNSAAQFGIAGQFAFGRDLIFGATAPTGAAVTEFRSSTLQTAVVTGGISTNFGVGTSGTGVAISAFSTANGVGGILDLQGPITGAGALQIGSGVTNTAGIVRLSASANGLGTSTFTGGVNIFAGRLQIAADTNFTGTTTAPIILSGPLGTGTLVLGRPGSNTTGQGNQTPTFVEIDAVGADRTIVNPLGAIAATAATTLTFGGHQSLTFTSAMDINSNSTVLARTFNTLQTQGAVTFSGNLTSSGAGSGSLIKSGAGTLVLTGTNSFTAGGAAGATPITISGGVLRVTSDVSLGNVSTTNKLVAISGTTANNTAGRLEIAGPNTVVFNAAASNRSLSIGAGGAGVIVSDPAGVLQLDTAVAGANPFNKEGVGTLRLNSNVNLFTNFTVGGTPTGGGTVSTTATSGTPFGTAASTIVLNNGVLSLIGGSTAQAITTANLEFRGGSYIQLNKGTTGSALTATALSRGSTVLQGTLTLLPSALTNLGSAASATSENVITSSTFANTSSMLTLPDVYTRLSGVGQDADFVQYSTNGFKLRGSNAGDGATILATTAAGNAIIAAAASADATQVAAETVNAVRTSSSLASPGQTLTITSGGLIMNRNTASANAGVTISTNLVFGASAAAPGEALVYTADGTASTPTISGSFTAANFTKSGPGSLLISGTGNVMAPIATGVGLRSLQINEGTLSFAGQASVPSAGQILVSPMDTAQLDLAGQSLTFAGLGNGTTSNFTATGNIINSGAATTLTLNGSGNGTGVLVTQFNGLISGSLNLIKSGTSTQILGANTASGLGGNTFVGTTTVNAGLITSGSGLITEVGTLQIKGVNTLSTGPISLAGGNLEFNNAIAAGDMYTNIAAVLQGGPNGYDVTVPALNNFGSANTTSTFTTNNTVSWQAINSLNVSAPVFTFAGASTSAILVKGTTTFNQATTINATQQAIFAGTLSAAGQTLTKIGTASLFLTGTGGAADGTGGAANSVGAWNILAGTVEARVADGGSSPLGANNSILLDGGTLTLRADGDNLTDAENLTNFSTNTLVIGSLAPVSSATYFDSASNTLNVGTLSTAVNKTVQLNQLQFGGPLGTAFLTVAALNNNYPVEFTNGLTMIKDAYLSINNTTAPVTISTALSGNGTLFKTGGGELDINTVATNTGGTVLNQGTINFGNFRGNTRTLSTTAQLGAGNITVNPSAVIRFNSPGNLNGGQIVDLRSSPTNYAMVGIGDNSPISSYNLRVPLAYGAPNSNLLAAVSNGSGVLAINSVYSQPLDLGKIGDGMFFLGSNNNGAGVTTATSVNGTYIGATPIAASAVGYNFGVGNANNANPTYRLGGGASFLNIGTIGGSQVPAIVDNAPNGVGATVPTSVVVGAPYTNTNNGTGAIVGNGTTQGVFFNTPQTYTGTTLVNGQSTLEIRSTVATSGYETFGTLAVAGNAGTFVGAPTPTAHAGATIRLDNSLDLLPTTATQGRWGDTTPVVLDGSTFTVIGNSAVDLKEVVGPVTVNGYSTITPRTMFAARIMEINAASITRGAGGIADIEGVTTGQIGSNERVTATTIANYAGTQVSPLSAVTNGMVAPWMYDNRDAQFLTYSDSGFVGAGYNYVLASAGTLTATNAAVTGTERLLVNGATANLPSSFNLNVWALRADIGIGQVTATDATPTLTIGSGGIIAGASPTTAAAYSITPKIVFGTVANPVEAIINPTANITLTLGDIANPTIGQITATAITKGSAGTLVLDAEQATFNGNINVGGTGGLTLRTAATATTGGNPAAYNGVSYAGGNGGTIFLNGLGAQLNLRSDHNQTYGQIGIGGVSGSATELGAETFANSIAIRAGNPLVVVTFDRAASTSISGQGISIAGGLTFGGSPGDQGQTFTINAAANTMNAGGTGFNFWVNGVTNLGPAGNAIFNLTNANNSPSMSLAGGITGAGTLVREGTSSGTLFLGVNGVAPGPGAGSTFTGGVTVIQGTLQANALAPVAGGAVTGNLLGTGNVTLVGGQLNVRVDSDSGSQTVALNAPDLTAKTYTMPNAVTVLGNSTINTDRIGELQILPLASTSITPGSTNIITLTQGTTAGLKIGQAVTGSVTGIAAGAVVTGITDATHFTVSIASTAAATMTVTAQSAYTNNIIAFPSLNIGGQTLGVSAQDTYGLQFNAVNLSGTPTFNAANDLNLNNVTDNGGGLYIVKNGAGNIWFNGTAATNNFSGGIYVNQGTLRFGNQFLNNPNPSQAGSGQIQINPQGSVRLDAPEDINTAAGQQILALGIPASPAVLRIVPTFLQTNLVSILNPASTNANIRIEAGSNANNIDLGALGDGTFSLGSTGSQSYVGSKLGVGAGNTYRLAVNDAAASVFTLAPFATAAPLLVGTGAKVLVGSLATGGNNGSGILFMNQTNTYTGGTIIARGSELRFNSGLLGDTPLGTGPVDAFGVVRAENANGSFKNNTFILHPGSTLRFENNVTAANSDRWNDTTPVPLNGATILMDGLSNVAGTPEVIGGLSFAEGSRMQLASNGTGRAEFQVGGTGTVSRVGFGTLVFVNGAAGRLGAGAVNNGENFSVVGGVANVAGTISNGMLPAYYIASTDNAFVTYGANGFTPAAYTAAALNLPAGRSTGTDIAQVTGNVTMSDNPSIYALGITAAAAIINAPGQINSITLDGAGATVGQTFGGILTANVAVSINPNILAGSTGQFELPIFVNGNTLTLNGDLSATGITKFGAGVLAIGKDQSDLARGPGLGYSSGWVINEGSIIPLTFGSLGNAVPGNTVTLNGSTVAATNNPIANAATLRLQLNQANTGIAYYSMGDLSILDNGGISYDPGADDRTQALGSATRLSNVIVNSTGGALLDAQFSFNTNRNRTNLIVGDLSVVGANAGAQINIASSAQGANLTSGISSGLSVASLTGTSDQHITKWGSGMLYVRGASTFAGAVNIEQGALQINAPNSLGNGSATNIVTVKRYGTLDLNTTGFARTDVIFQAGSLLRLTSDNAISSAAFNLGGGTLQVANDQTTTTTAFTMTGGGSIEGFLRTDDVLNNGTTTSNRAVYRTLGTGVTFNLTGNSFLGQDITQGVNGLDDGVQANAFTPLAIAANGTILEIKGVISGPGSLTKQGYDTVTLSGANLYSGGTIVTQGLLRAGATNALPQTGALSTSGAAAFDLNGFNQTVGLLSSAAVTSGTAGYITNSATTVNNLIVGNGVTGGGVTDYRGTIQYNVGLTKVGTGVQSLSNTNTYVGQTVINNGVLRAVDGVGLPATSNLRIDGLSNPSATYQPTTATFTRTLGTGVNQVQLTGGIAGFGAFGTPLSVDLSGTNLGAGFTIPWGSATFAPAALVLNGATATQATTFTNSLDLNQTASPVTRSVDVFAASSIVSVLSGNLIQSGAGAAGFTKAGSGTLLVSGANTYTGDTTLSAGAFLVGSTTAIPSGTGKGNVIVNGGATAAGTLDLNGFDTTINALNGTTGTVLGKVVNNGAAAHVLTVGSNGASGAFAGSLANGTSALGLTKTGAGTEQLSGTANTYSGQTTVSGGTLSISGSISGTTAVTVQSNATLQLSGLSTNTNRINDAPLNLSGGTLAFDSALSNATEHLGALSVSTPSIIDFGTGSGDTMNFSSINTATFTGLSIYNWTGTLSTLTATNDPNTSLTQDRLLFDGPTGLSSAQLLQINFYSDSGTTLIGTGQELTFNGGPIAEIVAVPEPSSTMLLSAAGLLGLLGYRHRRVKTAARVD